MTDSPENLRILLDTNVFISAFLVADRSESPPVRIVGWALAGNCTLVFPERVRDEIFRAAHKPYLRKRKSDQQLERLFAAIGLHDRDDTEQTEELPVAIWDPGDKFLLEEAALHEVDVLVSGDQDVLILARRMTKPNIVSPAEFVRTYIDIKLA